MEITGVQNEFDFSKALNNKRYYQLNTNAAKFIKQLYPNVDACSIVSATNVGGKGLKPDVVVSVDNDDTNVSIKKGGGNSVHQEKTSLFLLYCKEFLGMSDRTRDCFLAYLYGDGTLDGKGEVEERVDGERLKKEYIDEIRVIQDFLNRNRRQLIERFLVYGRLGRELNIKADYLYHGYIDDGVWCPLDETVDYLVTKAQEQYFMSSSPAIGPLTLQTWNRNIHGNPKTEDRRHSIQVKWGGKIREYMLEINDIYLQKIKQHPELAIPKLFGDNSHGFKNADDIAIGLNGCRVRNLRGSLLGLINTLFVNAALTDVIYCRRLKSCKPDIEITIGTESKNVSIFVGSGNSVHQENFIEFVDYCKAHFNMSDIEEQALKFVYYGDGTFDGSGAVENRLSDSRTIKKNYPVEVNIAQQFFDKHRRELASRFLVTGKYEGKEASDYVFHGNVHNGISISYDNILDYIESFDGERNGLLSIGPLSFQMWNRNLSGNKSTEYKRNSLQIKWASMPERIRDAYALMESKKEKSKILGINAEYELVSMFNRNRTLNNPLWKIICDITGVDVKHLYAVRVSHQVYSEYLDQTIYPKSDVYICKTFISEEILSNFGYAIDEDFMYEYNIQHEPIPGTGISCKIPSSKNYTYSKMSISSFDKIIGNKFIGAGACVFVQDKDISLNINILNAWGVNENDFINYFENYINFNEIVKISDIEESLWSEIKSLSIQKIKKVISQDVITSNMIFKGKGLFDEPYNANLIFANGKLRQYEIPSNYSVTTGSGRHKGKYSIVVKPAKEDVSIIKPLYVGRAGYDSDIASMVAEP